MIRIFVGAKQQKKFRRLLLNRIKWNSSGKGQMDDGRIKYFIYLKRKGIDLFLLDDSEEQGKEKNKCVLLWQVRKNK